MNQFPGMNDVVDDIKCMRLPAAAWLGNSTSEPWRYLDPDISGPGVRVSFYLQTLFLVVLVNRSWQDAPIALWTSIAFGAGMLIATISGQENMTLLETLQIMNLIWLGNVGIFISLASYSRQKTGSRKKDAKHRVMDYRVRFGAMIQTLASMLYTVYIWSRIDTIGCLAGMDPQNHINYVFFVGQVQATSPLGRSLGLAFSCIALVFYVALSLHELWSAHRTSRDRRLEAQAAAPPSPGAAPIVEMGHSSQNGVQLQVIQPAHHVSQRPSASGLLNPSHSPNHSQSWPSSATRAEPQETSHSPEGDDQDWAGGRPWASSHVDPMLVGILIFVLIVWTWFVVSCEMLILKNDARQFDNGFGFGQIVALVVVIPSLLSMVSAVRENKLKPLHRERKKSRNRNRSRPRPQHQFGREDPGYANLNLPPRGRW